MRFDQALSVASTTPQNYQGANAGAAQPYPGDVDGMTTASVNSGTRITPTNVPNVGYRTQVPVAQPGVYQPAYTRPAPLPITKGATLRPVGSINGQAGNLVQWNGPSTGSVQVSRSTGIQVQQPTVTARPLPSVSAQTITPPRVTVQKPVYQAPSKPTASGLVAKAKSIILPAKTTESKTLRMVGTDPVTTSSVQPVANAPTATATVANTSSGQGWSGAGGTWVTVRSGETLYNLSRRFGVPAEAIQSANNISDPSALVVGSRIMIPAYRYDQNAKVSAPDNNPITKASRSSTGFQGQWQSANIPTPKPRGT